MKVLNNFLLRININYLPNIIVFSIIIRYEKVTKSVQLQIFHYLQLYFYMHLIDFKSIIINYSELKN